MADANSNCVVISRFRFFVRYLRFSANHSKSIILGARALQELIEFYPLLSSIQHKLNTVDVDNDALKSFSDFLRLYRDLIDSVNESIFFEDCVVKSFKKSNASFQDINKSLDIFYRGLTEYQIQNSTIRTSD